MKRFTLIALAVMAVSAVAAWKAPPAGRHIRLGHEDGVPGRVRFLSQSISLAEGAKTSWITLTRVGQFHDPRYGDFAITPAMLAQMVQNFDGRVLGQDVFIDVAHRPDDGAAPSIPGRVCSGWSAGQRARPALCRQAGDLAEHVEPDQGFAAYRRRPGQTNREALWSGARMARPRARASRSRPGRRAVLGACASRLACCQCEGKARTEAQP